MEPRLVEARHIDDQFGYLKIVMFPGLVGVEVASEISRSLENLGTIDRLIIDLRGNTGGGIGALHAMSLLTPDRIPVGFALERNRVSANLETESTAFDASITFPHRKARFGCSQFNTPLR